MDDAFVLISVSEALCFDMFADQLLGYRICKSVPQARQSYLQLFSLYYGLFGFFLRLESAVAGQSFSYSAFQELL